MVRQLLILAVAMISLPASSLLAGQGHNCDRCGRPTHCDACAAAHQSCGCAPGGCEYVERTIYVPQAVTEVHQIAVEETRTEQKHRDVTVYKEVPVVTQKTREITVMVPETRTKIEDYVVSVPYWKEIVEKYCVQVPHEIKKTGTRTVYKTVPVKTVKTVCEDQGHWEMRGCGHCGGCGNCGCEARRTCCGTCCQAPCKVWVPNIVEKKVEVTVNKQYAIQVPHEYVETVMQTEERTRTHKVKCVRDEPRQREVAYTVNVPKTKTETFDVTTYKKVAETVAETYTVCVPYKALKDVEVCVQRMMPKTVTVCIHAIEVPCNPAPSGCNCN